MRSRLWLIFVVSCIVFCPLVFKAKAQGVIVPIVCERRPRCPIPPPRPIPIPLQLRVKSIKFDTKIANQVATTHVEQVFHNDSDLTLEGTYFFPIPESAAISEFAIWENDKRLSGEVRTKEEARRIYESIVRRQRDPGLLEYAGKDLFQATIFPIEPRSDKKLEITFTQVLKADNQTVSYRYALGTNSRAWTPQQRPWVPEPMPSVDDQTSRSSDRRVTSQIGVIAGKIEIVGKQPLKNIYSPSHSIETIKSGENRAVVTFESSSKNTPQDFQLFYRVSNDEFGLSLLTYREPGKNGYFLLNLAPKDNILDQEFAAKDVCFVLDTSGSMADAGKMEKARSALLFGIRNLRAADRFNVINFAGEEHLMESSMIDASAAGKKRGEEFVDNLKPIGGTNINDALRAAIKQFDRNDRPKMLVFMTDGLPTVGETNVDKIVDNVRQARTNASAINVFTFGVGYDVNTLLLDKIAAENGGASDYVEPKEDIEIKVSNFFTKVNSPVLSNLELDFGGAGVDLIYPKKLPDLFKGSQIIVIGRYRDSAENLTFTLRGRDNRENRTFTYQNLSFPNRAEENDFLPRLWATRRVGWLLEQIRASGEQKELRDEITDLGTRYGIVTPYTSYLAIDGEADSPRIARDPFSRPVARPSNGRMNKSIDRSKTEVTAQSGASAVQMSIQQNRQKENATVSNEDKIYLDDASKVKNVGNKVFYNESGVWQDAEFKPEAKLPEISVKFASEEYFKLLAENKELNQFFALGEKVIVVYKNKVYRINN